MGSEWKTASLDTLFEINPKVPLQKNKEYNFIPMKAVSPSVRHTYSSEKKMYKGGGSRFKNGDILLARITPCLENDKITIYKSHNPNELAHGSTEFFVIRGKQGICDNLFAYYLINYEPVKNCLISQMTGSSGRQRVPRHAFEGLKVRIPPLGTQRKIADILGSLDDKIELNHQMSNALEETTQALFKSWFVDFDPVHAKAAGNKPTGLSEEIADLFPDSFVDSEMGKIPKGWKVKSIQDIITRIPTGKKYEQKTSEKEGKVPVLDQGKSGIIGYHNEEPGIVATTDEPIIVFANHTCYMRLISYPFSAIQNVLPFIGKGIDTIWLYYASLGKQSFVEYKGHWPDFIRHQICVPNNDLDIAYRNTVTAMLQKIWSLERESVELSSIKNVLLPELLSLQNMLT